MDFSKKLRVTSIVVTHDLHSAFKIGDRFVMLDRGKIIAEGPPEEFKTNPDPRVRQFIDGDAEGPMSENLAEETLADDLFNTKVMRP